MKSLKLNSLTKKHLEKNEMARLRGGDTTLCNCACAYEHEGGSSVMENACVNASSGLSSPGDPQMSVTSDVQYHWDAEAGRFYLDSASYCILHQ